VFSVTGGKDEQDGLKNDGIERYGMQREAVELPEERQQKCPRSEQLIKNHVAQMFKFDFDLDLDDDLDLANLSIHISDNKPVPAPNNFNPSSEIHISQLVRIF
jgi:hypothetical protein